MTDTGYMAENLAEWAIGDIRRDVRSKRVYDYVSWTDADGRTHRDVVFEPQVPYVPTNSISAEYARDGDE